MNLLPLETNNFERKLESKIAQQISNINYRLIVTLWDAKTCPEQYLPYLAWALSVDEWQETWTESVKRKVIERSLMLHRIKGTRRALELMLDALGYELKIVEWWEQEPQQTPGTFVVYASTADQAYTKNEIAVIRRTVEAYKRLSQHSQINFTTKACHPIYTGAALVINRVYRFTAS